MDVGDDVEVRTHYTGTWSPGFTVAAIVPNGYLVRRRSDGALLPAVIAAVDTRFDHRALTAVPGDQRLRL